MRILLVEDDVGTGRAMQVLLESDGHVVHLASSVRQACEAFSKWGPHLALLDIDLADGSGWDVAQWIQANCESPAPPYVAITARNAPEDRLRSQQAGFRAHLPKPIRFEELRAAINDISAEFGE